MAEELNLQRSTWLHEVGQKLSPEGKLLLKLLYYKCLPRPTLEDEVREPRDLYTESMKLSSDQAGREHNVLSADDALAVFIHRLSILVPQPTGVDQLDAMKNLGAQGCLDNLRTYEVTQPPSNGVFSQESKLLECLVKSYVDMTPGQRNKLKAQLGKVVGVHPLNMDVFKLYVTFFEKLNDKNEIIDKFVCALGTAPAPKAIVADLKRNLENNEIPHNPFPDPTSSDEGEEDYGTETTPIIVINQMIREESPARCTVRKVAYCFVPCIPIMLAVLAIVVSTGSFAGQDQSAHSLRQFEVSSNYPNHCPKSNATALTRLGKVNSFWYRDVVIYQDVGENERNDYTWEKLTFYAIPSERVEVETDKFSCTLTGSSVLNIFPLYLLEGSNMSFHICIKAKSTDINGTVNLTIFDDIVNYYLYRFNHYNASRVEQYLLTVDANETNCSDHTFTAQRDSFYYVLAGNQPNPSAVIMTCIYDVDMRYLNSSNLSGMQALCVSTKDERKECKIPIGSGSRWLSSPQDYDIIASVSPSPKSSKSGKLKIRSVFRSAVYLIPAVFGVVLFGPVFLVCTCASCILYRRKGIKNEIVDEE